MTDEKVRILLDNSQELLTLLKAMTVVFKELENIGLIDNYDIVAPF